MKSFSYTARTKDGNPTKGLLSASDRTDALRQLHLKGMVPLSVTEGQTLDKQGTALAFSGKHLAVIIGIVLVALCCTVAWFLSGTNHSQKKVGNKGDQKTLTKKPDKKLDTKTESRVDNKKPELGVKVTTEKVAAQKQPPNPSHIKGENDLASAADSKSAEPKHFPSITEHLLALTASVPPGVEAPPLPDLQSAGLENDYTKASTNILVITEKDDEKLAALKEKVAWQKVDVSELVKQGYKLSDILEAIRAEHNENASIRKSTIDYLKDYIKDETTLKSVREDLPGLNLKLREKNLPEIELHEIGIIEE